MAAMLAGAMMLEFLGEQDAARQLDEAVRRVLADGHVTPDLGGSETTRSVATAVTAVVVSGFSRTNSE
jgi:tartrate dehydrogenase/decarboxylase/D-malate dehydrogenase